MSEWWAVTKRVLKSWRAEAISNVMLAHANVVVQQSHMMVEHDQTVLPGDEVSGFVVAQAVVAVDAIGLSRDGIGHGVVVVVEVEGAGSTLGHNDAGGRCLAEADGRDIVFGAGVLGVYAVNGDNSKTHDLFTLHAAPGDTVGLPADDDRRSVLLAHGNVGCAVEVGDNRQGELAALRQGLTVDGDIGRATGTLRL